ENLFEELSERMVSFPFAGWLSRPSGSSLTGSAGPLSNGRARRSRRKVHEIRGGCARRADGADGDRQRAPAALTAAGRPENAGRQAQNGRRALAGNGGRLSIVRVSETLRSGDQSAGERGEHAGRAVVELRRAVRSLPQLVADPRVGSAGDRDAAAGLAGALRH